MTTPVLRHEPPAAADARERGVALVLVLIFTVLLYALVADLVTTARTARLTGENDALLGRMRNHMRYALTQVEDLLLEDLAAAAASGGEGGEGGAMPGLPSGGEGGGGEGGGEGGEGEEEEDPAAVADCSQDAWFEPTAYADNDLTTYVWVEDENRKFNILALISPDDEFAKESKDRFVRLIDALREDSEFDVGRADGETLAEEIIEWLKARTRTEDLPRAPLKSDLPDDPDRSEYSLPLHLDELKMLRTVTEDLFHDKVLDSRIHLGLESVLTVYTSMVFDPGTPEYQAQQRQQQAQGGGEGGGGEGEGGGGEGEGGGDGEGGLPEVPEGLGILININTATRPVLRCLAPRSDVSDSVIEAILRWRNEEEEVDDLAGGGSGVDDYYGDFDAGLSVKKKVFTDLEMLEEIPEFANIPDPEAKDEFKALLTTNSDVFSVHMASLFKRSEENRVYVMTRSRSVMMRMDDGEDGRLHPFVLLEQSRGLRVMPVDLQDDLDQQRGFMDEMDAFSQEERAWNPFYLDFYRPREERERLYNYR